MTRTTAQLASSGVLATTTQETPKVKKVTVKVVKDIIPNAEANIQIGKKGTKYENGGDVSKKTSTLDKPSASESPVESHTATLVVRNDPQTLNGPKRAVISAHLRDFQQTGGTTTTTNGPLILFLKPND